MDIMAFLICLDNCIDKTTLRRLTTIVDAMLSMTGRVTMLGISRWTEQGGRMLHCHHTIYGLKD